MPDALPYRNPRDELQPPSPGSVFAGLAYLAMALGFLFLMSIAVIEGVPGHNDPGTLVVFCILSAPGCIMVAWLFISLATHCFRCTKPRRGGGQ